MEPPPIYSSTASEEPHQAQSSPQSQLQLQPPSPLKSLNIYDGQQDDGPPRKRPSRSTKTVLFDTVTIYHFGRSQGFTSVPTEGGSTLGMKCKHFLKQKISVDLHEEVKRRSHREILLRIRLLKERRKGCNNFNAISDFPSDEDEESYSDYSDISDTELEVDNFIFVQPISVKHRRLLLRASGVDKIDPKEKRECRYIRNSRSNSGCKCVGECLPDSCSCIALGVNCHVDRLSYPCGCNAEGCRNNNGRSEFDIKRVKRHFVETLLRLGLEEDLDQPTIGISPCIEPEPFTTCT